MNNPEISEENVKNPEISEENVKNPEISEAKYRNIGERKRFSNPEISEENKTNPEISAWKMGNPEISGRKIANPVIPPTYNTPQKIVKVSKKEGVTKFCDEWKVWAKTFWRKNMRGGS